MSFSWLMFGRFAIQFQLLIERYQHLFSIDKFGWYLLLHFEVDIHYIEYVPPLGEG